MSITGLTGTVKIMGTRIYAGCGHGAVKGFDDCPHCHIRDLEAKLARVRELPDRVRAAAEEIRAESIPGWGNELSDIADELGAALAEIGEGK